MFFLGTEVLRDLFAKRSVTLLIALYCGLFKYDFFCFLLAPKFYEGFFVSFLCLVRPSLRPHVGRQKLDIFATQEKKQVMDV